LLELKDKCAKSLESNLAIENITAILDLADLHNCSDLKAKAIEFIGRYFWITISVEEFY
jgi:hypothetical protein